MAAEPSPANGQSDVPTDVILAWMSNGLAAAHDVYLGTSSDDVTAANAADPRGVLVGPGQTDTTYQPAAPLEYGTTYFWRIDEVNGAPDNTVFQGETWSFTTEPFAYPIAGVIATASSSAAGMGPEKTVNGSGLSRRPALEGRQAHVAEQPHRRRSPPGSSSSSTRSTSSMRCGSGTPTRWSRRSSASGPRASRSSTPPTAAPGRRWPACRNSPRPPGTDDYAHGTTVDFGGVQAKYVKLTINSNWGTLKQYGLSEVRFLYVPVQARLPEPAVAATERRRRRRV